MQHYSLDTSQVLEKGDYSMTTATQQNEVLGAFAEEGFLVDEPDTDHVVVLRHNGQEVAAFSQDGVTKESIQNECATYLGLLKQGRL
jgi:hypothetical protein